MINSAATFAFGLPTSEGLTYEVKILIRTIQKNQIKLNQIYKYLKRNCLFKFETSIVSISITSIFLKPESTKFLRISQPKPPAPMTRTLQVLSKISYI